MANFELIDNLFQIVVLFGAMLAAAILGLRCGGRKLIVLACDHACFLLGTTFYTLHLRIMGDIPRIFYVSDLSWLASYLFFLLFMSLRIDEKSEKIEFKPLAVAAAVLVCVAAIYNELLGPSKLMSLGFGLIGGGIVYLALLMMSRAKERKEKVSPIDIAAVIRVILQILLYFVSEYTLDFTQFNLYFAVDILLTLTMVSLVCLIGKEVSHGTY